MAETQFAIDRRADAEKKLREHLKTKFGDDTACDSYVDAARIVASGRELSDGQILALVFGQSEIKRLIDREVLRIQRETAIALFGIAELPELFPRLCNKGEHERYEGQKEQAERDRERWRAEAIRDAERRERDQSPTIIREPSYSERLVTPKRFNSGD
jgi:hypothetical protein